MMNGFFAETYPWWEFCSGLRLIGLKMVCCVELPAQMGRVQISHEMEGVSVSTRNIEIMQTFFLQ